MESQTLADTLLFYAVVIGIFLFFLAPYILSLFGKGEGVKFLALVLGAGAFPLLSKPYWWLLPWIVGFVFAVRAIWNRLYDARVR